MHEVKRYDAVHLRYEDSNIRYGEGCEVEVVTASDYAALEAELARLRAGQEPVAYITGYHGGRCIIEPVNRAAVLPSGMALYTTPQPSAGVVIPERVDPESINKILTALQLNGWVNTWHAAQIWNACLDEFARLNGKEVGRG